MATKMASALVQVTLNQTQQDPQVLESSGIAGVEEETSPGVYRIDFEAGLFSGPPAVLVTQAFNNFVSGGLAPIDNCTGYGGGNTNDNAVVICVQDRFCRIRTGDSNGGGQYRSFSILAIGG